MGPRRSAQVRRRVRRALSRASFAFVTANVRRTMGAVGEAWGRCRPPYARANGRQGLASGPADAPPLTRHAVARRAPSAASPARNRVKHGALFRGRHVRRRRRARRPPAGWHAATLWLFHGERGEPTWNLAIWCPCTKHEPTRVPREPAMVVAIRFRNEHVDSTVHISNTSSTRLCELCVAARPRYHRKRPRHSSNFWLRRHPPAEKQTFGVRFSNRARRREARRGAGQGGAHGRVSAQRRLQRLSAHF